MGLVSFLVYYKQAELLRINLMVGRGCAVTCTHAHDAHMALGRIPAVHVSTFHLSVKTSNHDCTVLQLMEIGLRRMRRKRACTGMTFASLERFVLSQQIMAMNKKYEGLAGN